MDLTTEDTEGSEGLPAELYAVGEARAWDQGSMGGLWGG